MIKKVTEFTSSCGSFFRPDNSVRRLFDTSISWSWNVQNENWQENSRKTTYLHLKHWRSLHYYPTPFRIFKHVQIRQVLANNFTYPKAHHQCINCKHRRAQRHMNTFLQRDKSPTVRNLLCLAENSSSAGRQLIHCNKGNHNSNNRKTRAYKSLITRPSQRSHDHTTRVTWRHYCLARWIVVYYGNNIIGLH